MKRTTRPFALLLLLAGCASAPQPRCVFLLGRFTAPLAKPELANALRERGHTVAETMTPAVDLVVVGSDPINEDVEGFVSVRDLPEYATTTTRGIEILPRAEAEARFQLERP